MPTIVALVLWFCLCVLALSMTAVLSALMWRGVLLLLQSAAEAFGPVDADTLATPDR